MLQKILRLLRVSDVLFVDNAKRTQMKKKVLDLQINNLLW